MAQACRYVFLFFPNHTDIIGVLSRTFAAFGRSRPGFLSEKEFCDILNSFVCCEDIFYHHFFQLFDRDQDGYLTEIDFLSGMLSVSPITDHDLTKASGMLRLQLIFLYYDANRNGRLDIEELSLMIEHLEQLRSEQAAIDKGPKLEMRQIAISDAKSLMALYKGGFWYKCLYDACIKGMLSGMEQLLRTGGDLGNAILRINPQLADTEPPNFSVPSQTAAEPEIVARAEIVPPTPVVQHYAPQVHQAVSQIPQPVRLAGPQVPLAGPQVPQAGQTAAPSVTSNISPVAAPPTVTPSSVMMREVVTAQVPSFPPPQPPQYAGSATPGAVVHNGGMMNVSTMSAASQFALSSSGGGSSNNAIPLPLRIVRGLMDFTSNGVVDYRGLKMLYSSSELLALCDLVMPLLQAEDSLVSIPFPARLYGDIHGNLPDLVQFFNKYAWPDKRKGDILSMNYVFMGDFVDRGIFSVEVIALLFSLKVLYPTRVFLIRGNHEDRNMNFNFGFRKSCIETFGPTDGSVVWERVNECFDYLPIAGLVGQEVLCIHGGIGDSIESVGDLVGIEKPIVVPPESVDPASLNKVDRVVIDALWSDPYDPAAGSQHNTHISPRGNGASRFTPDRVRKFVTANNLQFIVRAHECVQNGYEYFADGLVLTVFSASSYCNQYNNDGGMVVVVKNEDGSLEEHAQIIKSNHDTRIGWDENQFRNPSPMRQIYVQAPMNHAPQMFFQQGMPNMMMTGQHMQKSRAGLPFAPVTYPASPGGSRLF